MYGKIIYNAEKFILYNSKYVGRKNNGAEMENG
jgi:hypothetical protein